MTFEYFKTRLDVHKTDFTLLVRDKFCLRLIICCCVLFRFAFHFSVLFSFFYHRGGDERKVRFFSEVLLSSCVLPLWLDGFNNFNSPVFHMNVCYSSNYH